MNKKYSIGVDFGSLSGRAVLVEVDTGKEVATSTFEYPHAVMYEYLPDGETKLGVDWALQDPQDYLDVLQNTIPDVMNKAQVSPRTALLYCLLSYHRLLPRVYVLCRLPQLYRTQVRSLPQSLLR